MFSNSIIPHIAAAVTLDLFSYLRYTGRVGKKPKHYLKGVIRLYFRKQSVGKFLRGVLVTSLLATLYQPIMVYAEETVPIEDTTLEAEMPGTELTTKAQVLESAVPEGIAIPIEPAMPEEGAILLGEFKLTYYCCEPRKHICGRGTGVTASGRPVEAGRSIAVDPSVIPLGSRVFIDFGDGEGWHEYSADDTGAKIEGGRIDIAVDTHHEALHQSKKVGRVCFIPPVDEDPAECGEFFWRSVGLLRKICYNMENASKIYYPGTK